jgi:hypothetical protein
MNENAGDFIAAAIVDIRGNIRIAQVAKVDASDLKSHRLGIVRDTKDYMQFYIRAGRGIEHPDTEKLPDETAMTRHGVQSQTYTRTVHLNNPMHSNGQTIKTVDVQVPKPGSPASDAQIKAYLLYGPMIIDFVEKNLDTPVGYQDGKGSEIRNAMNIKKKIEVIRKDAEDQIMKQGLPRLGVYKFFEEFKEKYIDPMSDEEKLMMDTTQMTKRFVDLYSQEVVRQKGDTTKKVTSLSQSDADDVLKRQADLQKKIELMRARRQGL